MIHLPHLYLTIVFTLTYLSGSACLKLVWSDEFDQNGKPNVEKWGYDIGGHGWGNGELQYYTNDIKNAFVKDGFLHVKAIKESIQGKGYSSARLVTKNKGDWKYGRVEVRAKLPSGRGTWPAIWMLPTDWKYGGWPQSGEIDIMEHVGYDQNKVHGTVHTGAYNHQLGTQKGGSKYVGSASTDFHNYAIEWKEDRIDFFIDDEKYFTFQKGSDDFKKWPFNEYFHLILNIAVGGSWGGVQGIDNSIFPQEMVVDFVRVYEFVDEPLIVGPASVVENEENLTFSCDALKGASYLWSVPSDAQIVSGQGTTNIVVNWGTQEGTVSTLYYTSDECNRSIARLNVAIGTSSSWQTPVSASNQMGYSNGNVWIQPEFEAQFIRVYSTSGKTIHQQNLLTPTGETSRFPVYLTPGIYLVKLEGEHLSVAQKIIVK